MRTLTADTKIRIKAPRRELTGDTRIRLCQIKKGKEFEVAGRNNCEKYKCKPKGVLFPIKKDLHDRKGIYTKCPYFECREAE